MNFSSKLTVLSAIFLISLTLFTLPVFSADFNITTGLQFDAGTKVNTSSDNDMYGIPSGSLALDAPHRKKDTNLTNYWMLERNQTDELGVNNLTVNGNPQNVSGMVGYALDFDGSGDYLIDSSPSGMPTGDRTTCFWFNAESFIDRGSVGVDSMVYQEMASANQWNGVRFAIDAEPQEFKIGHGDGSDILTIVIIISTGIDYHVCASWNSSAHNLTGYINGVYNVSGVDATVGPLDVSDKIIVADGGAMGREFDGIIDEIKVYDRVLSASEISDLYNSGDAYKSSGYWTSDSQSISTNLSDLTLNFFGVNATNYIEEIKFLNNTTSTVPLDNTYLRDDENISAYYKLDQSPSDETGNFDGTIGGNPTNVSGQFGGGYHLDGDDYVDTGLTSLPGSFTVSAWVNFDSNPTTQQRVVGKWNDVSDYHFILDGGSTSQEFRLVVDGSVDNADASSSGLNVAGSTWYHVVGVYDDDISGDDTFLYVNGALEASDEVNGYQPSSDRIAIAGWRTDTRLTGKIDDVSIFNRSLSADEIEDIYLGTYAKYNESITSGTNITLTSSNSSIYGNISNISSDFKVRTYFKGDSETSPTLLEVSGNEEGAAPPANYVPTIYLVNYTNASTNSSATDHTFYYNITDPDNATTSATFFIYNTSDSTSYNVSFNSSVQNNTLSNFSNIDFPDSGTFWFWINASDGVGYNVSENYTIIIDTLAPTINIMTTNASNTTNPRVDIQFNITDNAVSTTSATLYLYNDSDATTYNESINSSVLNNTATTLTTSSLPDGLYWFWINATDGSNSNESLNYTIRINTTCINPYDYGDGNEYIVNESTTICTGTYLMNDSESDGAIIINANDTLLDCAGSTIIGDANNKDTVGVYMDTKNNTTVQNCTLINYSLEVYGNDCTNITVKDNTMNSSAGTGTLSSTAGIVLEGSSTSSIILSNNEITKTTGYGVWLSYVSNTTLSGNVIHNNFDHGIYSERSDRNTFKNNAVHSNAQGVYVYRASNNSLTNNSIYNNSQAGIYIFGFGDANDNNVTNNSVYGNSQNGIYVRGGEGSIKRNNLINNIVYNNTESGIYLRHSYRNLLENNTIYNNSHKGIRLDYSDNTNISNNTISFNLGEGIYLENSDNDSIYNNTIFKNIEAGIQGGAVEEPATLINISNNALYNNSLGIYLYEIHSSNFTNNRIFNNTNAGINLTSVSDNNLIYNNWVSGNTPNVYDSDSSSSNEWNISITKGTNIIGGGYLGGNYWGDYEGVDTSNDGLGDSTTPYNSSGNISSGGDYHPLTTRKAVVQKVKVYKLNDSNYDNSLPRMFFANNSTAVIKLEGIFTVTPNITITDLGSTRVDAQTTTNESGVFVYNYTVNNSANWSNLTVHEKEFNHMLYLSEVWTNKTMDAGGQSYPFRFELNLTEPGELERHLDFADINVNFTENSAQGATNSSIRVVANNSTHLIEVPSQVYNRTISDSKIETANLVFPASINKSETRNYYVYFSGTNFTERNYHTLLNSKYPLYIDNTNHLIGNFSQEAGLGAETVTPSSDWTYQSEASKVKSSDNIRFNSTLTGNAPETWHIFKYSVQPSTDFEFIWEGYMEGDTSTPTGYIGVWNETDNSWTTLSNITTSEATYTSTINASQVSDLIVTGKESTHIFFTASADISSGTDTVSLYTDYVELNSNYSELENDNLWFKTNYSAGGVMNQYKAKRGTNSNISGNDPMVITPQVQKVSSTCAITSQSTPSIEIDEGPNFIEYTTSGLMGTCSINYSVTYRMFRDYVIIETNTISLEGVQWDYYYDQKLLLQDGIFRNISYMDTSNSTTTQGAVFGDGTDSGNVGNLSWVLFYNNISKDYIGDMFLEQKQSKAFNVETNIYDAASYEYYTRSMISAVTPSVGDYFYTKVARTSGIGNSEYNEINETYTYLNNPLIGTEQSSTQSLDQNNPIVVDPASITPASPSDIQNITCSANFSDDTELNYVDIKINSSATDNVTRKYANSVTFWPNLTVYGGDVGAGQMNCTLTAYDLAGNSNSTNASVSVSDSTPPSFTNISHTPNTAEEIDPGVEVNVTANITEYSTLSTVNLVYMMAGNDWSNFSMTQFDSGDSWTMYYYSLDPNEAGNWTYKVYAEDNESNKNTSTNTTIEVDWEYTWNSTPSSLGEVQGNINSNYSMGNITLNNTGDKQLTYQITESSSTGLLVSFDGSRTFNLSAGNNTSREVFVQASTEANYEFSIKINSTNTTVSPDYMYINGTAVVAPNGPVLYMPSTYRSTPLSVIQGDSDVSLTAKLQNSGTDTAQNVTFGWTLPSDWSLASGTLNDTGVGNLSVDEEIWNNITINVNDDATTGTASYTLAATCKNCTNQSVTIETDVVEKSTSEEVGPGGGGTGGGGGGGGLGESERQKVFQTEEMYDIVRGRDSFFRMKVENPFTYAPLKNTTLNVSGFLAQYLSVEPAEIKHIGVNESESFFIHITAPEYFTVGKHNLILNVKGTAYVPGLATYMDESRNVTLFVHTVSREEAEIFIEKLQGDINEMNESGFKLKDMPEWLEEAKSLFEEHDYDAVKAKYEQSHSFRDAAFTSEDKIAELENKIQQAKYEGVKTPRTEKTLNLAKAAFLRGDYNSALERIEEAEYLYVVETKGEFNLFRFIIINWKQVILGTILASIAAFGIYWKGKLLYIDHKLDMLREDQKTIIGLMQEVQKETFKKKTMSMSDYNTSMEQYEKQLASAVQNSIAYESERIAHKSLLKAENRAEIERKRLMQLIKETQNAYLKENKIETRAYKHRINTLRKRLSEVEEELAVQEAGKAIKERGWLRSKLQFRKKKPKIGKSRLQIQEDAKKEKQNPIKNLSNKFKDWKKQEAKKKAERKRAKKKKKEEKQRKKRQEEMDNLE